MSTAGRIRAVVLGLIQADDYSLGKQRSSRLFVAEGYDPVKQDYFYRALGGGIEFGETSRDALIREFKEEIQADLTNIQYLGCVENLFVYNGELGHEIVQLYRCDFADSSFYQPEQVFRVVESQDEGSAYWIDIDRFTSGELRLVPEAVLEYLQPSCG